MAYWYTFKFDGKPPYNYTVGGIKKSSDSSEIAIEFNNQHTPTELLTRVKVYGSHYIIDIKGPVKNDKIYTFYCKLYRELCKCQYGDYSLLLDDGYPRGIDYKGVVIYLTGEIIRPMRLNSECGILFKKLLAGEVARLIKRYEDALIDDLIDNTEWKN